MFLILGNVVKIILIVIVAIFAYQFLILGNVEANIFEEKIDEMYQFLILGNVENFILEVLLMAKYQFLISGNVEQQIVFICIITSGVYVVKREMPVHRR